MNQNKNNNFINDNFETFTIEKIFKNSEYIIHKFRTDYRQIPNFFEYFFHMNFLAKKNQ
jgi:hypothetical protein